MDINNLKYFVQIAKELNINAVSRNIHITPSALSKAVFRLEEELEVPLFSRVKGRLVLTQAGEILLSRASQLLQLEEEARSLIRGKAKSINVNLAGPEVCLLHAAEQVRKSLLSTNANVVMQLFPSTEEEALARVDSGECHLAAICGVFPEKLRSKSLRKVNFVTCASSRHPLGKISKASIPIEEVLKHPFIRGDHSFFGDIRVESNQFDGWREDKFPRLVHFKSSSLKVLEHLLLQGAALAYLPDYYAETLPLKVLKVTGCPYTCRQTLKLVACSPSPFDWIENVFALD